MRLLVYLLAAWLGPATGTIHRFKTIVEAGKTDCFTVDIQKSLDVTAAYMVISADQTHDIQLDLRAAADSFSAHERRPRGIHAFKAAPGEMSLCLDNSYSYSAEKLVAVSIHLADEVAPAESLTDTTTRLADRIQRSLKLAQNELHDRALVEQIHRTIAESNFESINFWGIVNSCAMLSSSLVQVAVIRRLLK